MARLNIERQERLEPERIAHAVRRIEQLGYTITLRDNKKIQFTHKGKTVTFFPYSGWATGKTIQDGRGLDKCFHITGSIAGMKRMFYGKDALLVRCGSWIYNVSKEPRIYHIAH